MKRLIVCIILLLTVVSLFGCKSYIKVQNQNYRIGAAHSAALGAYGIARFEGKNLFERDGLLPFDDVEIIEETTMDIEDIKNIEANLETEIEKIKTSVAAGGTAEAKTVVTYRLRSIASKQELVDKLNQDKQNKVYKTFRSTKDARIISSVLVGYGHSLEEKMEGNTKIKTNLVQDIGNVEIKVTGGSVKKLKFSDGTILGYTYDRACWKKTDNNEWIISRLLTDNPTMLGDANCPDDQLLYPE